MPGSSDTKPSDGGAAARIVLADDDALLRVGIASLLEGGGHVIVGQVGDASELVPVVREQQPDLVVLDLRMPPGEEDTVEAGRAIRAQFPGTAILFLSAYAEIELATEVLEYGERIGYLLKSSVGDADELLDAVDRLLRGGSFVDPALVQELFGANQARDPLARLSPREREVLALMAQGLSNAGIAQRLWITQSTVEKHVRSIFAKLRLPETADAHRRVLAVIALLDGR
jgi:DNA-binding NarL/FixJ family response regulator